MPSGCNAETSGWEERIQTPTISRGPGDLKSLPVCSLSCLEVFLFGWSYSRLVMTFKFMAEICYFVFLMDTLSASIFSDFFYQNRINLMEKKLYNFLGHQKKPTLFPINLTLLDALTPLRNKQNVNRTNYLAPISNYPN